MRRVAAAVFAMAVVAAGCGGDDDGDAVETTLPGGVVTTTSPGAVGTTVPSPGASTTAADGSSGGGTPSTAIDGGAGGHPPATTAAVAIAPGGVGDLAAPLLQPGHGDRIVVEVRAQSGAAPRSGTIDHLTRVLRDASGKAVNVDGGSVLTGGARDWTAAAIVAAADAAADHGQGGTQVTLRLLFLRGTFDGDDSVLGVAVRGDVAAIFSDQVDATGGLLVSSATIEDAVTMHEVGHLLGLVDIAIDTGRDDPSHPGHSTNEDSVMYWAVESDLVTQVLGGGVPTDFDAQDRTDLARIRAG